MEKLLTLKGNKGGSDVFYRSVGTNKENPNAKQDYEYCYDLAKRTVMEDILGAAGEWPEEQQHEFFSSDFYQDDTYILECDGKRIGCFGIYENDTTVTLGKCYIEPDYQSSGIGSAQLKLALQLAHEKQKPLQAAVLKSNEDMYETALKYDFVETEGFIMHGEASWVQMHILTHKDTLPYMPQADNMFLSYK